MKTQHYVIGAAIIGLILWFSMAPKAKAKDKQPQGGGGGGGYVGGGNGNGNDTIPPTKPITCPVGFEVRNGVCVQMPATTFTDNKTGEIVTAADPTKNMTTITNVGTSTPTNPPNGGPISENGFDGSKMKSADGLWNDLN